MAAKQMFAGVSGITTDKQPVVENFDVVEIGHAINLSYEAEFGRKPDHRSFREWLQIVIDRPFMMPAWLRTWVYAFKHNYGYDNDTITWLRQFA